MQETSTTEPRPRVQLGVVIPAGPADDVLDTLDSVRDLCTRDRFVVVVNDTGRPVRTDDPTVEVIAAPTDAPGGQGGLWVKIAAGYRHLLACCRPELVLRLDADALVIGPGLERAALDRFAAAPGVGMLGAHRIGPDGGARDFGPAARLLASETGWRGLRAPRLRALLRAWTRRAGSEYEPGEHALGGAYIHRGEAAATLLREGLLDAPVLATSRLGEDHLMALATIAAGWSIGDFSGPGQPMAVRWRGLPAAPDDLIAAGALVTHSVRSYADLDEPRIRALFRARRHGP